VAVGTVSTHIVQTEDFVTRLVFKPERMKDLRTGAKCLDEVIKNQIQAIEDAERAQRQAIANEKAAKTKVRSGARYCCRILIRDFQVINAAYDDRQRVAARVERERLARERGVTQADDPVPEMADLEINTV
jgi:hypothetical protein